MDLEADGLCLNPSFTLLALWIRARHLSTMGLSICICKTDMLIVPPRAIGSMGEIKWHHVHKTLIDINILFSSLPATKGHR